MNYAVILRTTQRLLIKVQPKSYSRIRRRRNYHKDRLTTQAHCTKIPISKKATLPNLWVTQQNHTRNASAEEWSLNQNSSSYQVFVSIAQRIILEGFFQTMNNTEDRAYMVEWKVYHDLDNVYDLFFSVRENDNIFFKRSWNILMFKNGNKSKVFEFQSQTITIENMKQMYTIVCNM